MNSVNDLKFTPCVRLTSALSILWATSLTFFVLGPDQACALSAIKSKSRSVAQAEQMPPPQPANEYSGQTGEDAMQAPRLIVNPNQQAQEQYQQNGDPSQVTGGGAQQGYGNPNDANPGYQQQPNDGSNGYQQNYGPNYGPQPASDSPPIPAAPPGQNPESQQPPQAPPGAPSEAPRQDSLRLPENKIPVLAGGKESKKAETSGLTRVLITLGVLTTVVAGTLFGLKKWSAKRGMRGSNTKIQMLTQHALGPKKSLAIIQVAGETMLIGITDHNISMIKSLALIDDEFPEALPSRFDHALEDGQANEEFLPTPQRPQRRLAGVVEGDDFAVRALGEIRDTVSTRLRNLKNL